MNTTRRRLKDGIRLSLALFLALPAFAAEPGAAPLRVLRFVSGNAEFAGSACFGVVWQDREGIPTHVVNLGYLDAGLCRPPPGGNTAPAELRAAFEAGGRLPRTGVPPDAWVESISSNELAHRILPPVAVSADALSGGRRIIMGVGLNYVAHRREVGAARARARSPRDLIFFPKATPPTGAYAVVPAGVRIGSDPPAPVILMDYEVEIGLVFLEDIDLAQPPRTPAELQQRVAYFAANDVSDRTPIIRNSEVGFAQGKSHPGYLPIGPWMVHGRELDLRAGGMGSRTLRLALMVSRQAPRQSGEQVRQSAMSDQMLYGPLEILAELARRYRAGEALCMPDARGAPARLHDGRGRIPAGSILLTGTPAGTAIRAPGFLDRLRLFVAGGFSVRGARERLILEHRRAAGSLGYLKPESVVRTSVELLGTQLWRVVPSALDEPHGAAAAGGCRALQAAR